jgi:hypothetical protein
MSIPRSEELVVLWVEILAPPPTRTAQSYISANRQSPLCGPFLKYRPQHHLIISFRGLSITLQLVPHIVVMGT